MNASIKLECIHGNGLGSYQTVKEQCKRCRGTKTCKRCPGTYQEIINRGGVILKSGEDMLAIEDASPD